MKNHKHNPYKSSRYPTFSSIVSAAVAIIGIIIAANFGSDSSFLQSAGILIFVIGQCSALFFERNPRLRRFLLIGILIGGVISLVIARLRGIH